MEFLFQSFYGLFGALLGALDVVEGRAMDGAMHMIRVKTDMFHDVDFTIFRPTFVAVWGIGEQQPYGRPGADATGQFSPRFEATVHKITLPFGQQTGGGVFAVFHFFMAGFDGQVPVFYPYVFGAIGVALHFIVVPVATQVVVPFVGVGFTLVIEFIFPAGLFGKYPGSFLCKTEIKACPNEH